MKMCSHFLTYIIRKKFCFFNILFLKTFFHLFTVAQICNRKVSKLVPKKFKIVPKNFKIVPKKFKNSAEKIQNSAEKIQK